ncbi:D-2-hydroxyglutarate dehydrogenase [Marinobacterium lacunae]|uniref:D-2-hydroxyglutarate dehydrogenase n=1 Tax=Marinobacterium lacunae TaxID=1232683 RepID=A0A081FYL7_9GAMM|nr:FAD-binding oxidoreductase [Marinobacterium lacunae]KEA63622.1 D-2-hydroxyglutarate dehydrogenase [Marinobacterium lacunae]
MNILLDSIEKVVGSQNVLRGEDVRSRTADWMTKEPCLAGAIVRPANTEQLSEVMALCYEANQAVVTHGGLTGLVRGGMASSDELVISLERMTQIESIDCVSGTMTVQAGAPLQSVQEAADQAEMQFNLDLGARGSCTIGGNIATNAGGIRVIRYGMMRDLVLGVEAVLADGTVVNSMNTMLKNNAGYDLKQLFIGSEGTLGIVTRAVLKLHPQLTATNTALVACEDFNSLTGLLQHARKSLGGELCAFEVMWSSYYSLLTTESNRHTPPISSDAPYYVLIESLGAEQKESHERFEKAIESAFEKGLLIDAVLASSDHQREKLWAIREDVEGLAHLLAPRFAFDISLPILEMDKYVRKLQSAVSQRWKNAKVIVFGHLGDGNLHVSVATGDASDETREAVESLVYEPLKLMGGSVSAEHGIGLKKRKYLNLSRTPAEIALMQTLKIALDPRGLLNRNKVLPDILA